jgi:NAD(P)-dependent dehydrogenase (short-subunit alcohol dehydrogenase family)
VASDFNLSGKVCLVTGGNSGVRAKAVACDVSLPDQVDAALVATLAEFGRIDSSRLPRIPAGRWGVPGDMAGIAVYLAADVSGYHSGDTFLIDGGYRLF